MKLVCLRSGLLALWLLVCSGLTEATETRAPVHVEPLGETPETRDPVHVEPLVETPETRDPVHVEPLVAEEKKTNETEEERNIRCRLPVKVGSCRAAFPRFYYNVTNQTCEKFTYGGCDANNNNFESRDECEAACSGVSGSVLPDESTAAPPLRAKVLRMIPASETGVSQDVEAPVESEPAATEETERCGMEPEPGPCRAAFQRWYHDRKTGSCRTFIYGGCRGNKNNYETEKECITACTVTVLPSAKKVPAEEVSAEHKEHCMVAPDSGPCRAAFRMFYYDPDSSTCQPFIYGGCQGNKNRYGSVEECEKRCTAEDCVEGRSRTRNRWTAAVFLFVTLAAISALLLATLIIISVRRRSLTRRPSSISDKEELLPDPDEQSSVESLTVPDSPKPDKA